MTEKELRDRRKAIHELTKEVSASPKEGRELLVKAGIITPRTGKLTKPYK